LQIVLQPRSEQPWYTGLATGAGKSGAHGKGLRTKHLSRDLQRKTEKQAEHSEQFLVLDGLLRSKPESEARVGHHWARDVMIWFSRIIRRRTYGMSDVAVMMIFRQVDIGHRPIGLSDNPKLGAVLAVIDGE